MFRFALSAFIVIVLSLLTNRVSAEEKPVRIALDVSNWPYAYESSGQIEGLYPAIAREAFHRMGANVILEAYPWKRLIYMIDRGEIGVLGIYKNSKRQLVYDFSEPYFRNETVLFALKDKAKILTGWNKLVGRTIGVGRGFSYGDQFDDLRQKGVFKVFETDEPRQGILLVFHGRVDAFATTLTTGRAIIMDENLEMEGIVPVAWPLAVNNLYIAFNKKSEMTQFLADFNQAIRSMHEDGTYKQIFEWLLSAL